MRRRRTAKAVPELDQGATRSQLARRLRGEPRQLPPGRRRAPPGDTTIPRQELAHVGRGAFAGQMLALEWADTVHRR
jgi:hypothetical protein